ncbi:hypothetical protein CL622_08280 [archaeon]|nr:hypothetical protein [archaeon]
MVHSDKYWIDFVNREIQNEKNSDYQIPSVRPVSENIYQPIKNALSSFYSIINDSLISLLSLLPTPKEKVTSIEEICAQQFLDAIEMGVTSQGIGGRLYVRGVHSDQVAMRVRQTLAKKGSLEKVYQSVRKPLLRAYNLSKDQQRKQIKSLFELFPSNKRLNSDLKRNRIN